MHGMHNRCTVLQCTLTKYGLLVRYASCSGVTAKWYISATTAQQPKHPEQSAPISAQQLTLVVLCKGSCSRGKGAREDSHLTCQVAGAPSQTSLCCQHHLLLSASHTSPAANDRHNSSKQGHHAGVYHGRGHGDCLRLR